MILIPLYVIPLAKYLIQQGANDFNTALCNTSSLEIAKFLVEQGTNNFKEASLYNYNKDIITYLQSLII